MMGLLEGEIARGRVDVGVRLVFGDVIISF